MTYFADLTEYSASDQAGGRPKNIGWLGSRAAFDVRPPTPAALESLWQHCSVAVNVSRGVHSCHLCEPNESNVAERNGQYLLLGAAEIRVMSNLGVLYAAPNLIYHYVAVHHYAPPREFEEALVSGVSPSSKEYFEHLSQLGIDWDVVSPSSSRPKMFRFVRAPQGVKKVEE
jgi:hypothetical protein